MNIKRGLSKKKKLISLMIISIFLVLSILNAIYKITIKYIQSENENRLIILSDLLGKQINGDKLNQAIQSNRLEPDLYNEINDLIGDINKNVPEIMNIYAMIETQDLNIWKVVLTTDGDHPNKTQQGNNKRLELSEEYKVYLGHIPDETTLYKEQNGVSSIYTTIWSSTGKKVAVLGLDINERDVIGWTNLLFNSIKFIILAAILVFGYASLWYIEDTYKWQHIFIKQSKEILNKKERIRFSEDFDGEWELLGIEFNKILEQNWQEQAEREAHVNEIIKEKNNIFEIYRDVIEAVTRGRVSLRTREQFLEDLAADFPLYSTKLVDIKDITRCRKEVDQFLGMKEFPWWNGKNRRNILLCLSEAITNVIKHAGDGEVILSVINNKLIIYILDNGDGIDLKKLPYTIFINGFSTKESSLGAGFILMEKSMDRIILSTTKEGTFLALEKKMEY